MIYVLCLGGNEGNTHRTFELAIQAISHSCGTLIAHSPLYLTPPWGFETEKDFLNQIIAIDSDLSPHSVLDRLLEIEKFLGRVRHLNIQSYHSRTIDLDIIYAADLICDDPVLQIPHPRMHLRRFVLEPLVELFPDMVHPVLKETNRSLLKNCPDTSQVERL